LRRFWRIWNLAIHGGCCWQYFPSLFPYTSTDFMQSISIKTAQESPKNETSMISHGRKIDFTPCFRSVIASLNRSFLRFLGRDII
jgi:hypothetical protein